MFQSVLQILVGNLFCRMFAMNKNDLVQTEVWMLPNSTVIVLRLRSDKVRDAA